MTGITSGLKKFVSKFFSTENGWILARSTVVQVQIKKPVARAECDQIQKMAKSSVFMSMPMF